MKLTVVSSLYKRELPDNLTGNGGVFLFDCRVLPNPFCDEPMRRYTGCGKLDTEIFVRFFDKENRFIGAVETLVRRITNKRRGTVNE